MVCRIDKTGENLLTFNRENSIFCIENRRLKRKIKPYANLTQGFTVQKLKSCLIRFRFVLHLQSLLFCISLEPNPDNPEIGGHKRLRPFLNYHEPLSISMTCLDVSWTSYNVPANCSKRSFKETSSLL